MGRRRMPTGNSQGRSSRMASGKRASMREGPLAALFRKTEEEGLRADEPRAADEGGGWGLDSPPPNPQELPPRRSASQGDEERPVARKPVDRLRDVFSSDIPENIMERAPVRQPEDVRPRYGREEPSPAATAPQPVQQPVLRVVGVGGAGVNAVNRMIEAGVAGGRDG